MQPVPGSPQFVTAILVAVVLVAIAVIVYARRRLEADRRRFQRVLDGDGLTLPQENETRQANHAAIACALRFVAPSWRYAKATERLEIPRRLYHTLVPGISRITLGTRAGRLGFQWIARPPRASTATPAVAPSPSATTGLRRYE